jgi:hypothetical protein
VTHAPTTHVPTPATPCRICRRPLTTPGSIRQGIGPECRATLAAAIPVVEAMARIEKVYGWEKTRKPR